MKTVVEYVDRDALFDEDEVETFDRIVQDPNMLGGKPTIKGHRISVQFVLGQLSNGETVDSFARRFHLERDDVVQAVRFAASKMTRDLPIEAIRPK
jgi:uncharacterized protein (DUF433 family)